MEEGEFEDDDGGAVVGLMKLFRIMIVEDMKAAAVMSCTNIHKQSIFLFSFFSFFESFAVDLCVCIDLV